MRSLLLFSTLDGLLRRERRAQFDRVVGIEENNVWNKWFARDFERKIKQESLTAGSMQCTNWGIVETGGFTSSICQSQ